MRNDKPKIQLRDMRVNRVRRSQRIAGNNRHDTDVIHINNNVGGK